VTRVMCSNDRIVNIGKVIREFNAIDTGVFLCTPVIFDALQASQAAGDDSISGAMNVLAGQDKARVFDIQDRLWLDVDDPATLDRAEALLQSGRL
jgi:1L-myo-inositol 1-phosphate cytidylyltransferase